MAQKSNEHKNSQSSDDDETGPSQFKKDVWVNVVECEDLCEQIILRLNMPKITRQDEHLQPSAKKNQKQNQWTNVLENTDMMLKYESVIPPFPRIGELFEGYLFR